MTTSAIIMLVVAITLIWGGLAVAIFNLSRSPEVPEVDGHGMRDL